MKDEIELVDISCPTCKQTITRSTRDIRTSPKFRCPIPLCRGMIDATELAKDLFGEDAPNDRGSNPK